jgi:hypothetical protein
LQHLAGDISFKTAPETWRKTMTRYYKVDSRNITFAEYWRMSTSLRNFTLKCICKIIRLPLRFFEGIPEPTTFGDKILQKTELPPHLVEKLDAGVADFEKLGFGNICYYNTKNKLFLSETAGVHLLHGSGETTVTVVSVKLRKRERTVMSLASLLKNGRVNATSNRPAEYDDPPGVDIERMVGNSASQLWQRHSQKLEEIRVNEPLQKFSLPTAYEKLFEISTKKIFEHNVQRGLWVEMNPDEIAAARKRLPPQPPNP